MNIREFLDWMAVAPAATKGQAIRNLARAFLDPDTDADTRHSIETALTISLDDPDAEVRFALADVLGNSSRTPRHIVFALAADRTDIAILVLARSPVFIDTELCDIVAAAEPFLQIAVARRMRLSQTVAAAIAEVGEKAACLTLLANATADIARLSFRRMAERFGGDAEVREALVERRDLPSDVRQLIVRAVGNALGNLAVNRHWLTSAKARTITRDACDRATVAIAAESQTEELPALVEHLRATEQLTTSLLLRAVCAGNIAFFETALAMLARMPITRVESLVRAGRQSALRAAYAKAGLPRMAFDAFLAAVDAWRRYDGEGPADRYRFTLEIVNTVLAGYADITDGEANDLAAMLRRFAADQARDAARDTVRLAAIETEDENAGEEYAVGDLEEDEAAEGSAVTVVFDDDDLELTAAFADASEETELTADENGPSADEEQADVEPVEPEGVPVEPLVAEAPAEAMSENLSAVEDDSAADGLPPIEERAEAA